MKSFKAQQHMTVLALTIAAIAATGCWDDDVYKKYVKDGEVTPCNGYCTIAEDINKDKCISNNGIWDEARCENELLKPGIEAAKDAITCNSHSGSWKSAYCHFNNQSDCTKADSQWHSLEYRMLDLGNGQYIFRNINGDDYCGTFESIAAGNKGKCTPKDIERLTSSIKAGLCPSSANYCVAFDSNDSENRFAEIKDVGICNSCPQDQIQCEGQCVDIMNDPKHCGGCGISCVLDELCIRGTCAPIDCQLPSIKCDNQCVDIRTDKYNCGGCGKVCGKDIGDNPDNYICDESKCYNNKCPKGKFDTEQIKCFCSGNNENDLVCGDEKKDNTQIICIDSHASETCGAIDCINQGTPCSVGQICNKNGECECANDLVTSSDKTKCLNPYSPETCGVTKDDVANNKPFKVCNSNTELCDGQDCKCLQGFKDCGNGCVDVLTDPNNCGTCGHVCGNNAKCSNGSCFCNDGYSRCFKNGQNVICGIEQECHESNYPEHCGAKGMANDPDIFSDNYLGKTCQNNEICFKENGDWTCGCKDNRFICGDKCIDPMSDLTYCGADDCNSGINCTVDGMTTRCQEGRCVCENGINLRFAGVLKTPEDGKKYIINSKNFSNYEFSHFDCIDINSNSDCCGTDCAVCGTKVCNNGTCDVKCPDGMANCNGNCLSIKDYNVIEDNSGLATCRCNTLNGNLMCPTKNNDPNYGCTATLGDNNNCGECGNKCPVSFTCMSNVDCRCDEHTTQCTFAPETFDNNTDPIEYCINLEEMHMIDCENCMEHWGNLDQNWANGCETDLSNNLTNCGSVGRNCNNEVNNAAGVVCIDNECAYTVCNSTDYLDCTTDPQFSHSGYNDYKTGDGCETDIMNDVNHCGRCNNQCVSNSCENGSCCYKDDKDIYLDISKFNCCDGQKLMYKKHIFLFCPDPAHYGCIDQNAKSPGACWKEVTSD